MLDALFRLKGRNIEFQWMGDTVMDSMHGGKAGSSGERRAERGRMWSMWFCIGVGILILLTLFFWR